MTLHGTVDLHDASRDPRSVPDLYRLLIESVTDYAIFSLNATGHVVTWNPGAQRFTGYTASEIIGRHFSVFYPEETVAAGFPQYELEVATREGRFEDEGWRVRKDGSRFWADVVITALCNDAGELIGFAKVSRDLTARRAAEEQARQLAAEEAAHAEAIRRGEQLAQLNEQLEQQAVELEQQAVELEEQTEEARVLAEHLQEMNDKPQEALLVAEAARDAATEAYRDLDEFAYVASHDLKAPLRGIANLAQWIEEDVGDRLGPESTEHLRLLQGRVHRMEALIDGILAYSRAGRILHSPEPVDTGALVREVVEFLALPAEVRIEVPEHMPTIEAERVPLQQVFMNLIGNALKYTHTVRPDVRIGIAWRDAGDAVEFAVSDNGPGIAPAYHDRIWGIFQTLAARDKVEGTGIGLSVVKKIVETRGGHDAVESAPDQGATFHFAWPKAVPQGVRV
jgi:PAS domain S-box-containing protein